MSPYLMPFGKFKNVAIEDVPESYLHWCVDYLTLHPDLENAIRHELTGRSLERLIGLLRRGCLTGTKDLIHSYIRRVEAEGYQHPLLDELKSICKVDEEVPARSNE